MSYKQIPRNRPIATLVEWYTNKKSGKVTDARKEIQKRFDYLDWDVQKSIVLAFLQSAQTDRQWAYGKVYRQWDDDYMETVKSLWERYHESLCAWSVMHNRGTVLLLSCCDNERTVPVYVELSPPQQNTEKMARIISLY